jgi:MoxR-like ATPase
MNNQIMEVVGKIRTNVSQVLVGKESALELALVAIGCEGHILLEDVPGVGKTMLARSLAVSLGLSFSRIQCTPDLLPSDVTGMMVFNPKTSEFNLRPGPIMSNIVLVDEINRATPRTQSGLLEAMEERQVTIDSETRKVPRPFLVMATQNPVEYEGTFPLPEAQLDRFLIRISLGYPEAGDELKMLSRLEGEHPINVIQPVVSPQEVDAFIQAKKNIYIEESLRAYVVEIISRTRSHPELDLGVSPRGTIAVFNAARVLAAIRDEEFVIPEYIKYLAPFILAHRVIVKSEASIRGVTGIGVVQEIINSVPVPTERAFHE